MQEEVKEKEQQEDEGQIVEIEEEKSEEQSEEQPKVETSTDTETATEEKGKEDSDADDVSQYSESVKKRIAKLTKKYRDEEKERAAAVQFAESVKKQNDELKLRLDKLDTTYVGEFDTRVQSQAAAAKEAYRKAYEAGDSDAMYEAQQTISKIALEEARLNQIKADREEQPKRAQVNGSSPPVSPPPPPPKPDPRAEQWAEDNEWFGSDRVLTSAAMGIHEDLMQEGIETESDEYYNQINKRMKDYFAQRFAESSSEEQTKAAPVQNVASVSRRSGGRKSVKLTKSQVVIAKKLGVPLEEYAKYVKEGV